MIFFGFFLFILFCPVLWFLVLFFPRIGVPLICFFRLAEGVVLRDFEGQEYYTFAHTSRWGEHIASVYPWTGLGHVILNEDGTCGGGSSYIEQWKPL